MFLKKINKAITYTPMVIIWEYIFLFTIRSTDWYARNAVLLDNIDNCVLFVLMIHFLCFIEMYSKLQIVYFFCLFLIVQLQLAYYFIPENIYYLLYLLFVTYPLIRTFF